MKEGLEKDPQYFADKLYASYFIDSRYFGRRIGEGGEARVYELRSDFDLGAVHATVLDPRADLGGSKESDQYVLKVPRFKSLEKHRSRRKLQHYTRPIALFDNYIVNPSYILERSDGNGYAVLQRRLDSFEDISLENVSEVDDQMEDFFVRHREFVEKGYYIDIVGLAGYREYLRVLQNQARSPILTNMVKENTPNGARLQIHDVSARNLRFEEGRSKTTVFLKRAMFGLEKKIIRDHFGFDIGTFVG